MVQVIGCGAEAGLWNRLASEPACILNPNHHTWGSHMPIRWLLSRRACFLRAGRLASMHPKPWYIRSPYQASSSAR